MVAQAVAPTKYGEPSHTTIVLRVRLYEENGNEQVRINMSNIGNINVCLASFLTKGVSYAQEKFNEYKTKGDEADHIEEPKAEAKVNTRKTQRGGKQ